MKVTVEMTPAEYETYLLVKKSIEHKRETQEIVDLYTRLQSLSNLVYKALAIPEESGDIEIINESYADAALKRAIKELF